MEIDDCVAQHQIKFNLYTKEQPGLIIAQLTDKTA